MSEIGSGLAYNLTGHILEVQFLYLLTDTYWKPFANSLLITIPYENNLIRATNVLLYQHTLLQGLLKMKLSSGKLQF